MEKVGNEKQFKFNQSVEARFDSAISAIEKKKLEEGKKLLSERQKLIKLVDRSECGWATVSAYVTDDLADTPEDERRIYYVCLGVCAGMWVISRDMYLGVLVLYFISVLLFQRSDHFCLFLTF